MDSRHGQDAVAWIYLAAPTPFLVRGVLMGAGLGVLWLVILKLSSTAWIALISLLILLFVLRPAMPNVLHAGRGAWNLKIGKGSLFIDWPRLDALISAAGLAITVGFLLFPPHGIQAPLALLGSPARLLAAGISIPDDATAVRCDALLAAAIDTDPRRVEGACRDAGIELPVRLPDRVLEGLRERVEALRAEGDEAGDGRKPRRR